MDAEQFETWKNSPATQWVMVRLAKIADLKESSTKDALFMSGGISVADWQVLQVRAAEMRGQVQTLREMIALDLEDLSDE